MFLFVEALNIPKLHLGTWLDTCKFYLWKSSPHPKEKTLQSCEIPSVFSFLRCDSFCQLRDIWYLEIFSASCETLFVASPLPFRVKLDFLSIHAPDCGGGRLHFSLSPHMLVIDCEKLISKEGCDRPVAWVAMRLTEVMICDMIEYCNELCFVHFFVWHLILTDLKYLKKLIVMKIINCHDDFHQRTFQKRPNF